jgi:hypothetical protein
MNNTKTDMKQLIRGTATYLAALLCASLTTQPGLCSGANSGASVATWRFDSSASTIAPEFTQNVTTVPQASIQPGPFSGGWISQNDVLGTASGIWDLGRSGSVTCTGLSGVVGSPGTERVFTVQVKQYDDGGIYSTHAALSIPGASCIATNTSVSGSCPIGDWVTETSTWHASSEAALASMVVTSPADGALLDELSIQTASAPLPPPRLTITSAGDGLVHISWPSSYQGYSLEGNGELTNPLGWLGVSETVQPGDGVFTVTIAATNASKFYRLKQP